MGHHHQVKVLVQNPTLVVLPQAKTVAMEHQEVDQSITKKGLTMTRVIEDATTPGAMGMTLNFRSQQPRPLLCATMFSLKKITGGNVRQGEVMQEKVLKVSPVDPRGSPASLHPILEVIGVVKEVKQAMRITIKEVNTHCLCVKKGRISKTHLDLFRRFTRQLRAI